MCISITYYIYIYNYISCARNDDKMNVTKQ